MKIFIDTASIEEIKKYLAEGLCDGVTTNPTTFVKAGILDKEKVKERILEIAKLIDPRPLSVEVTSENPEEIISQAREFTNWALNIVVKVTVIDRNGNSLLSAINQLVKEGIIINVTSVMTYNQAILTAKTLANGLQSANAKKPHFISIFAGRIAEEHGVQVAFNAIKNTRDWLDCYQINGVEILIASVRSPENVEYFSRAGGHAITIPPEALAKSLVSAKSKEGVAIFIEDARKSS
ncbi:MAG: transaldolase family protein [Patescibacteria group bacterium]